ncbi:MAG: V4R domain-containing protein [Thermoplasmata archaeon]
MRFVKISQDEIAKIRNLYEGVMSYASHGLFYHEGLYLGEGISKIANKTPEEFIHVVSNILIGRGWAQKITFENDRIVVEGSIEVTEDGMGMETCHRMRGILSKVCEIFMKQKVKVIEAECQSLGDENCVFIIEKEG